MGYAGPVDTQYYPQNYPSDRDRNYTAGPVEPQYYPQNYTNDRDRGYAGPVNSQYYPQNYVDDRGRFGPPQTAGPGPMMMVAVPVDRPYDDRMGGYYGGSRDDMVSLILYRSKALHHTHVYI